MFSIPVRLLGNAVCQRHYASHAALLPKDVGETHCKSAGVQARLAFIRWYYGLFRTGTAIFTGPYFAGLADRHGRQPVYRLALIGLLLQLGSFYVVCSRWDTFPPEVSWATGLFTALGGGQFVLVGLNLTMISDVSAPNTRDRNLYIAFAVRYGAAFISPQVVATALDHSLWFATLIAALCLLFSLLLIVLTKEPMTVVDRNQTGRNISVNMGRTTTSMLKPFTERWPILLTICINFCLQFRMLIQAILVSYVSVRFDRTISQVTRLMSIQPAVNLFLFLILPAVITVASHNSGEQQRGFQVFRPMMLTLCLGDVVLALAPNLMFITLGLVVSAVGDGIRAPLLVIASAYIDQDTETGRLYTWFAFTDALSHTVGDPFLQYIWRLGPRLQGNWLTLPIWVTLLFTVFGYAISTALPKVSQDATSLQDEQAQASQSLLSGNDDGRRDANLHNAEDP